MKKLSPDILPLQYKTPDIWANSVLTDIPALLSDHAYLEKKAATNALDLLNNWPEPNAPKNWANILASIARDEALHLHSVLALLQKKGGKLARLHKSKYASDLRRLVRKGFGPQEVADRLLVSALIEARSCERFDILARCCKDKDLSSFYKGLWKSEEGHFHVFYHLAEQVLSKPITKIRWKEMVADEADIIEHQPPGPCLHSGLLQD